MDRCLADDLRQAGGLLPGLDPELQQAPLADLLLEELRQVGGWGGAGSLQVVLSCAAGTLCAGSSGTKLPADARAGRGVLGAPCLFQA